jgi:flavin reductase (DIM6/NTAB) family NADH-FMN oxidoreductase RutF
LRRAPFRRMAEGGMGDSADHGELRDAFRDVMRHVAATVHAVTTFHDGERYGILATSVSSLSFDPPSLLVCINRTASLHDPIATADRFCVNVLGVAHREVARCLERGGAGGERFAIGQWIEEDGVPVLADAQSSLICRVALRREFGTHTIFVGEVTAVRHRANAKPLTYYDRRYIDITGAPDLPE